MEKMNSTDPLKKKLSMVQTEKQKQKNNLQSPG